MLVEQSGLFEILRKWAEIRTQRILKANREQCLCSTIVKPMCRLTQQECLLAASKKFKVFIYGQQEHLALHNLWKELVCCLCPVTNTWYVHCRTKEQACTSDLKTCVLEFCCHHHT
jgi:hypothetical protein